ncbi:hypothetical protein E2320_009586, partial [Naja naja]
RRIPSTDANPPSIGKQYLQENDQAQRAPRTLHFNTELQIFSSAR